MYLSVKEMMDSRSKKCGSLSTVSKRPLYITGNPRRAARAARLSVRFRTDGNPDPVPCAVQTAMACFVPEALLLQPGDCNDAQLDLATEETSKETTDSECPSLLLDEESDAENPEILAKAFTQHDE